MNRDWSQLQLNVFLTVLAMVSDRTKIKATRGRNGAILVRARAGTGKTTVIVETIKRLLEADASLSILYSVFNTRNVSEAQNSFVEAGIGKVTSQRGYGGKTTEKFTSLRGTLDARTMNSLGLRALNAGWNAGKAFWTEKGNWWLKTLLDMEFPPVGSEDGQMKFSDRRQIEKLVNGAMAYLAHDDESLLRVLNNSDLGIELNTDRWSITEVFPKVRRTLDRIVDRAYLMKNQRGVEQVSFAHQIYVPARLGMKSGNYDVVLIDEGQDQSPAKMRLLELALAPNGIMVVVGDPAQAIYGFAGADSDSLGNYCRKWDPTILPLSITYRCPVSVVEHVKNVVPDYTAGPGTPMGRIEDQTVEYMHSNWQAGDLCISRTNAPLVSHCLAAWRQNQPACIVGKDFGEDIEKRIQEAIKGGGTTIPLFCAWVSEWEGRENERLLALKRDTESERDRNSDIADTLISLTEGLSSVDELLPRVARLFVEKADPNAVIFSSTHKFKGGEAFRVWMFVDTYKPTFSTYRAEDPVSAEDCIWYVAATRCKVDRKRPDTTGILFQVPVKGHKGKKTAPPPPSDTGGEIPAEPIPSTPSPAAEAIFRQLCLKFHPDQGGTEQQMVRINAARGNLRALEALRAEFDPPKPAAPVAPSMALAAPSTRKAAAKPARAQKAREEFEGTVEQALQKTVEKYRAAGHTVSEEMIPKIREILREQLLKAHKAG